MNENEHLRRLVNPPSKIIHEIRKLLAWQNSCGTYLGRLEDSENEHIAGRVVSRKHHGQTIWIIHPPQFPDAPRPVRWGEHPIECGRLIRTFTVSLRNAVRERGPFLHGRIGNALCFSGSPEMLLQVARRNLLG